MNKLSTQLPGIALHLVLLPLVLLWVPLVFAMAWVREAFEDMFRPAQLRPASVVLARSDAAIRVRPRY